MILYLDTSALVKLYTDEASAGIVRGAANQASVVACHDIGYVEARAALARKHRDKDLDNEALARCKAKLDDDWRQFHVVAVTVQLLRVAADLAESYGLRAYDSIHLAAAEAVQRLAGVDAEFRFAVFDGGLRKAAFAHGLLVLD